MKNILEYKGYYTKIEFDPEGVVFSGIIEGISDFVNFESEDIGLIEEEFHSAVDDYIEFCRTVGKEPEVSYNTVNKSLFKRQFQTAKAMIK